MEANGLAGTRVTLSFGRASVRQWGLPQPYAYSYNNPVTYVDPDGEQAVPVPSPHYLALVGAATLLYAAYKAIQPAIEDALQQASPNGGTANQHGGKAHNDAIDARIGQLRNQKGVRNIRKNQRQVDVNGNQVGTNRPDIQYDLNGKHHNVEYDHSGRASTRHSEQIRANDPESEVELNRL